MDRAALGLRPQSTEKTGLQLPRGDEPATVRTEAGPRPVPPSMKHETLSPRAPCARERGGERNALTRDPGMPCSPIRPGGPVGPGAPWKSKTPT